MPNGGYQKAKLENVQADVKEIKDEVALLRKDVTDIKTSIAYWKGISATLGAIAGLAVNIIVNLFTNK